MSFKLNDVASSSSSSSDAPPAPSDGGSSDREVDESLARDVRSALHLAVGKICRAEDAAAREAAGGHNGVGSDAERSAFATSREAIAALTDLAYHHATTLMANDLVAFSKHARRRTVKTDDVLLLARKDRRGVLADLKRAVEEDPERYSEATKGARARSRSADARGGGAARKKTAAKSSSSRRRSKGNGGRRSKSKPKAKGKKAKEILPPPSSSSSASSGSEDSDDENDELKMRRKKLDEERRLARMKKSTLSANATDEGSDLASFIATDGTEEDGSSVDVEFDISAAVSKMSAGRKGGPGNGRDRSDSDECVAELVGGKGEASGVGDADDAMAIDLTADD